MKPSPTLVGVLDRLAQHIEQDPTPESLTTGEVIDAIGRRAYGPLLLVIGLVAVSPITSIPGSNWFCAAVILLIAGQMALGRKRPWLPNAVLNLKLPRTPLLKFIEAARPRAEKLEKSPFLQTRLAFLSDPPWVNVSAIAVMAAALVTFPLALIPLGPLLPGLTVVFFGLGMTGRDGLWLLLGMGFFTGACWLAAPLIF